MLHAEKSTDLFREEYTTDLVSISSAAQQSSISAEMSTDSFRVQCYRDARCWWLSIRLPLNDQAYSTGDL